jgi:K+-transporting ATPase ATPase C chain
LLYPALVTGIAQVVFPLQANGSLLTVDGSPVGSVLIGQSFSDPGHFWGRPSATQPFPYNASASAGSNLGPTNPVLLDSVRARAFRVLEGRRDEPVPIDLLTASGSGLDPHISLSAALFQIPRVARVRGITQDSLTALVVTRAEGRQWGVFGEPRVNVLKLNLELDGRLHAGREQ